MRARLRVDPERVIGRVDPNVYGQFLSRRPGCSEGGLYDPAAGTADAHGIRADVSAAIAACRPGVVRWPGGCTGTSYFGGPQAAAEKIEELAAIGRTVFRTGNASSTPGLPARFAPRRVRVACTEWNAVPPRDFMSPRLDGLGAFSPAYRLHDALAVATFANVMQRHCRDISLATVAQSINVVGLIGVDERGMWLEPSYWAWHMAANHSGPLALDAWTDSPAFDLPAQRLWGLPYLDASATLDPQRGTLYLSLVNRHRSEALEVDVRLADAAVRSGGQAHLLHHDDPDAMNSHDRPEEVRCRSTPVTLEGDRFTYALPPHAYAVLELPLGA